MRTLKNWLIGAGGLLVVGCVSAADAPAPMRIGVMDFTTVDMEAQKYLHLEQKPLPASPAASELSGEDRSSLAKEDQGYIRSIETEQHLREQRQNREQVHEQNRRLQDQNDELRDMLLGTRHGRAAVLGADMLATDLAQSDTSWTIIDRQSLNENVDALRNSHTDNPSARLAQQLGATHLVYGIVEDLDIKHTAYTGYGIQTLSNLYRLNVLVRMVEISTQKIVFSGEFSAQGKQTLSNNAAEVDTGIIKDLLRDTLKQATTAITTKMATTNKSH